MLLSLKGCYRFSRRKVTMLGYKGVVCHSGEPEGCGDREEAQERPEENQSPSG